MKSCDPIVTTISSPDCVPASFVIVTLIDVVDASGASHFRVYLSRSLSCAVHPWQVAVDVAEIQFGHGHGPPATGYGPHVIFRLQSDEIVRKCQLHFEPSVVVFLT